MIARKVMTPYLRNANFTPSSSLCNGQAPYVECRAKKGSPYNFCAKKKAKREKHGFFNMKGYVMVFTLHCVPLCHLRRRFSLGITQYTCDEWSSRFMPVLP